MHSMHAHQWLHRAQAEHVIIPRPSDAQVHGSELLPRAAAYHQLKVAICIEQGLMFWPCYVASQTVAPQCVTILIRCF